MQNLRRNVMTFREGQLLQNSSSEMIVSLNIVRSAYRSIMKGDLIYVSMPITSGERYYNILESYGVFEDQDLPEGVLYNEIIAPNIQEFTAIAKKIQNKNPNRTVIAPSIFEAKKQRWSQEEYMYLWYWVLQDKISTGVLADKFSNGGSEEAVGMNEIKYQMIKTGEINSLGLPHYMPTSCLKNGSGIAWQSRGKEKLKWLNPKLYDTEGHIISTFDINHIREGNKMEILNLDEESLSIEDNATIIRKTIENLKDRGFKTTRLETCLLDLGGIAASLHFYRNFIENNNLESSHIYRGHIYDEIAKVISPEVVDMNNLF